MCYVFVFGCSMYNLSNHVVDGNDCRLCWRMSCMLKALTPQLLEEAVVPRPCLFKIYVLHQRMTGKVIQISRHEVIYRYTATSHTCSDIQLPRTHIVIYSYLAHISVTASCVAGTVLYSFIRRRSQGEFHSYGLTTVKRLASGEKVEVKYRTITIL